MPVWVEKQLLRQDIWTWKAISAVASSKPAAWKINFNVGQCLYVLTGALCLEHGGAYRTDPTAVRTYNTVPEFSGEWNTGAQSTGAPVLRGSVASGHSDFQLSPARGD